MDKVEDLDYFGVIKSSVDLNITGDNNATQVTGSIEVADETHFKMALPESRQFDKKEGLIKFVRRDALKLEEELKPENNRIGGFDNHQLEVNARIEIDEKASLRIIIDPRSEDFLEVSGEGNLVFRMEKSGYMSLNGAYQVTDGAYNLSL
ncbi:MAG: translocation/assembly module TamB domain-containing protein [Saprospiraceae bacterium]